MITGCEYPTILRTGMPVDYRELGLDSRLNKEQPRNYNIHHELWRRKAYKKVGGFILYQTLRDLESHVRPVLLDMHGQIHEYDPPRMATPLQAITEIERAKDAGEQLKEYHKGIYVRRSIGDNILQQCIENYNQFKRSGE